MKWGLHMKPELETRFVFGKKIGSTIVEISNSNEDVIIRTREEDEHVDGGSYLFLDPQEVDFFIAALTLHKHKVLNPRKAEEE